MKRGGIKWDAVYLTTVKHPSKNTQEGDIILDLWRSADMLTAGDAATYSGFWSDKSTDKDYPSNMYSTSKIRVETLNAGGKYTKIIGGGPAVDLTEHIQDSGNKYARFTMESVPNSLTEYLAKPSEVGYQETEFDEGTMKSFYGYAATYYFLPNDAYGTPNIGGAGNAKWYSDTPYNMDYSSKGSNETAYDAWQDDYLWLPSLTETGMSNDTVKDVYGGGSDFVGDGMWNTDAALRSANSGVGLGRCWLRSGGAYDAQRAYLLNASGNRDQLVVNNANIDQGSCGVRPALHFNLSVAARKAILDKDSWKNETKTYSPDGVKWRLVDTDMVEISAVEKDGDKSWYDDHTITADKVGKYELKVTPSAGFTWKDDTDNTITVTYTVVPDDMTVTFNNNGSGVFNNERLEKRRDIVYSLGMEPIELKLPDPTDKTFPINWKDVAWYDETISKLEIQYIVRKYEETEYDEDTISSNLDGLKDSADWKDYENLTDKTAREPMYYVVYFKAVDTEGNHNTCYNYFVVHIVAEKLNITLSEAAKTGFEKGVEYGDVAHTKDAFEKDILSGIQKVIGQLDRDKTRDFKDNIDSFIFYLRKDNAVADNDIYTVAEDGILHESGSQSERVDNLPLGTYHLYVAIKDENASEYISFEWTGGNPSFTVSARKIKVTLTFEEGATYGDAHTGWVTATASRATEGAVGSWYAQNEAKSNDDFDVLGLSYSLQGMSGMPSISTPAGTYPVTPTCSNTDYNVEFADEHGGKTFEYAIAKATLTVTANNKEITYGDDPSDGGVEYSGFVNEENENVLSGTLAFDYGGYAAFENVGEYVITPSGLSSDNYDFDYKEGTLTVTPKEIQAVWGDESYTYTGSAFTKLPTATAAGIGNDGTFTLLVALSDSAQTFQNAGGYAFKAALDGANPNTKNYTLDENTETHAYIVEKQTVTAPTIASKVYNGVTQTADVDNSALYSVTENNGGIDVGDYEIKLALKDSANFKWATSDEAEIILIFTITKADYVMSGVTFKDVTVDYDGQAHSITIEGDLPKGVSVTYEGNGQTAVGKYTVMATFKGDAQNYNPIAPMTATLTILTITKQQVARPSANNTQFVYTGAEQVYAVAENPAYTVTGNRQTNANEDGYTVTVALNDKTNYEWSDGGTDDITFLFKIAKAPIAVKWQDSKYIYTGTVLATPSATVQGLGDDGEFALDVTLTASTDAVFKNAGTYTFTAALKQPDAANYTLTGADKTYTVAKQSVAKPNGDDASFVYTGAEQVYTVAENPAYTVTGNRQTNANEDGYTVTVTLNDKTNYTWSDGGTDDITFLFKIKKADYDMSGVHFSDKTVNFDGKEHSILIEGNLPEGVHASYQGNGQISVGGYHITVSFTGDAENYNPIPSMHALLTIWYAEFDLGEIRFEDDAVKYDGNAHSIYVQGSLPASIDVAYVGNEQSEPGVYTVRAILSDARGVILEKTATLTILKASLELKDGNGNTTLIVDSADGIDPTLELTIEEVDDISRTVWAWQKDTLSKKCVLKFMKDGVEVPIDGKVTVRLLIPEEFRDKEFTLQSVGRAATVEYTRDGDYVVFEADGLSAYTFTMDGAAYLPILLAAAAISILCIGTLIVLAIVKKKNKKGE